MTERRIAMVETRCQATCVENWELEVPAELEAQELRAYVESVIEGGNATLMSEAVSDEHDRAITRLEVRDPEIGDDRRQQWRVWAWDEKEVRDMLARAFRVGDEYRGGLRDQLCRDTVDALIAESKTVQVVKGGSDG